MAEPEPDGTQEAQQHERLFCECARKVFHWLRAIFSPWYYVFPRGAFFLGSVCGAGLMFLILWKFILKPSVVAGMTSVPVLIGISFLSSMSAFVLGRYLLMFGAWLNSLIWRLFRIPPAPSFFERALAAPNSNRVAILAGTLKWTEQSSYNWALKLLEQDQRGTKEIYLFYKAGADYKRANVQEYKDTMKRVAKLVTEYHMLHVYPNPGRLSEIEGCLSPDAFALITHLLSKQEFQRRKERWNDRPANKRGPEPCNDFVVVFRNRSLVKALWDLLNSYMLLDFADTDSVVEEACKRVKEEFGIPAD